LLRDIIRRFDLSTKIHQKGSWLDPKKKKIPFQNKNFLTIALSLTFLALIPSLASSSSQKNGAHSNTMNDLPLEAWTFFTRPKWFYCMATTANTPF